MDLVICLRSSHRCITDLIYCFANAYRVPSPCEMIEFCILKVERGERQREVTFI